MDDARQDVGTGHESSVERAFRRVRPLVLRAVVGSIVAAALVGVGSALAGDFGPTSWRLLGTIALFVFFAFCCWYDADVSARRSAAFGVTSIAVSILLLLVGVTWLWLGDDAGRLPHWLWIAVVGRVALLHVHLLLTNKRRFTSDAMQAVTVATIVLVGALAVLLVLPSLASRDAGYPELYWRIVVAVAILDLLGTVLIPLTYALFHGGQVAPTGPTAGGSGAGVGATPGTAPAPAWRGGASTSVPAYGRGVTGTAPTPPQPPGLGVTDRVPGPGTHASTGASAAQGAPPGPVFEAPPASAYPLAGAPYLLEWPRYANGQPLPARADGSPDFTGVRGWVP
ncbi:hypothetical protein [Frigoribacterium salinisoli]